MSRSSLELLLNIWIEWMNEWMHCCYFHCLPMCCFLALSLLSHSALSLAIAEVLITPSRSPNVFVVLTQRYQCWGWDQCDGLRRITKWVEEDSGIYFTLTERTTLIQSHNAFQRSHHLQSCIIYGLSSEKANWLTFACFWFDMYESII